MTRSQKLISTSREPFPASGSNEGVTVEHVCVLPSEGSVRTQPLLQDVSFRLAPNTVTLIAGHTGSGKSTLLQALAGLLPIHQGQIAYGDQELRLSHQRVNEAVLKSIGLVFQYPERQLFAESIEKELRYSLRPYRLPKAEQHDRIRRALHRMALPDAFLEESFLTLSDGQKRKAAIASTIVTEPQWLLLDEPTAGIDPQGISPLLRLLAEHKHTPGGGVIVVSHDLDTFLPLADRVLLLQDGTIAADGTPEELLSEPEVWFNTVVGLPSALALALTLEKHGLALSTGRHGEEKAECGSNDYPRFPLEPEAMAEAILRELRTQELRTHGPRMQDCIQREMDLEQAHKASGKEGVGDTEPLPEAAAASDAAADRLMAANLEAAAFAQLAGTLPPLVKRPGDGTGEKKSSQEKADNVDAAVTINPSVEAVPLPRKKDGSGFSSETAAQPTEEASQAAGSTASPASRSVSSAASGTVSRLHPIAKWFVYMLLSAGILLQHSWSGLGAAALITILCIVISGSPYRSLWKPAKPFIYFIVISTLISGCGISWEAGSWKPERLYFILSPALQTLQLLFRFLLVMLLGVLLAVTTGTKMMQAGLEQAFGQLERLRIPVAAFTFFATLLVRFLPMLLQELDRTALIVQARGKTTGKRGLLRLREVPVFLIPFLLSMMKHAEDLSLALEARGYQLKRLRGEGRTRLRWTNREWLAAAAGAVLFGVLYLTGR